MRENQLVSRIIVALSQGMITLGINDVAVRSSFQPNANSPSRTPSLYIHPIGVRRYGYNKRLSKVVGDDFVHEQKQIIESTYQITGWVSRSLTDVNQITATDLVNYAASIFSSDKTRRYLKAENIGMLRITDIRQPHFRDEQNKNEMSPSFDVTFRHSEVITTEDVGIEVVECNIKRV